MSTDPTAAAYDEMWKLLKPGIDVLLAAGVKDDFGGWTTIDAPNPSLPGELLKIEVRVRRVDPNEIGRSPQSP